jgi:acyl-CoA thioesterase I
MMRPHAGDARRKHWSNIPARLLAGLYVFAAGETLAQTPANLSDAEACLAANRSLSLGAPLPRTMGRLNAGEPLRIVAVGSSSTTGLWVLSPDATYPEVMRRELARLRPNARIEVINSGRIGETIGGSIGRFDRDVLVHRPDLVIWQLGTNAALRDLPIEETGKLIREGIQEIKDAGSDVLLVDPQFVPKVIAKPEAEGMVQLIATTAGSAKVNLFRRFAVMRHWHERSGMSFDAFTSPDGLHMNDWGYGCWAKLLCTAISDAAKRAVTSAHASPAVIRPNNRPATQ